MANLFDLKQLKCKTCAEPIDPRTAVDGVITCPVCDAKFIFPKQPASLDLLTLADNQLNFGKFDEAYETYKSATERDNTEPDAYFGMALASHKVRYVKDVVNRRLQPICYDYDFDDFKDDKNYQTAMRYATSSQRTEYEKRAEEIDYIKKEFSRLQKQGINYDCFICVKVTETDGSKMRTLDYKYADDIYFDLRGKGFKPFFSERELVNVSGADYEARILYALVKSECMLVVCSNPEYLKTPWVQNEYSRFLKLVNDEEKDSDSITIAYIGRPIEKLAGKNGKIQGINLGAMDALEKVRDFVEMHTPEAKRKKQEAEEARRKAEEEELQKRREEEARREEEKRKQDEEWKKQMQAEQDRKIAEIASMAQQTSAPASGTNIESLMQRAEDELKNNEFEKAFGFLERVHDEKPHNSGAWFGKLLVHFRAPNEQNIIDKMSPLLKDEIDNSREYRSMCEYKGEPVNAIYLEKIDGFLKAINAPALWFNLFLKEMGVESESQIIDAISYANLNRIRDSRNYKNANLYMADYPDKEVKKRIDNFEKALSSAGVAWQLFLEEFNVKDEESLKGKLDCELYERIESSENYANIRKNATGSLKERIEKFDKHMHTGGIWWEKFLSDFGAKAEDDILKNITDKRCAEIANNKNYQIANKNQTSDVKAKVTEFNKRLQSSSLWWYAFLRDMKVEDEGALLATMTPAQLEEILGNESYKFANKYLTPETKDRIEAFNKNLKTSAVWWDALLRAFEVKNESELLATITPEKRDLILKNQSYKYANEYSTPESRDRIAAFNRWLETSAVWWDSFLRDFNVKNEAELFATITPEKRDEVLENESYKLAIKYGTPESKDRIAAFNATLNSFALWWHAFLAKIIGDRNEFIYAPNAYEKNIASAKAKENMLLTNFDSEKYNLAYSMPTFNLAQKFASGEEAKHIKEFKAAYDEHKKYYDVAVFSLSSLLKDHGCKSDFGLWNLETSVITEKNFIKAKEAAAKACCREITERILQIEEGQPKAAKKNKSRSRGKVIKIILRAVLACLPIILELIFMGILGNDNLYAKAIDKYGYDSFWARICLSLSLDGLKESVEMQIALAVVMLGLGLQAFIEMVARLNQNKKNKKTDKSYVGEQYLGFVQMALTQVGFFIIFCGLRYVQKFYPIMMPSLKTGKDLWPLLITIVISVAYTMYVIKAFTFDGWEYNGVIIRFVHIMLLLSVFVLMHLVVGKYIPARYYANPPSTSLSITLEDVARIRNIYGWVSFAVVSASLALGTLGKERVSPSWVFTILAIAGLAVLMLTGLSLSAFFAY